MDGCRLQAVRAYSTHLVSQQDKLLESSIGKGAYNKLYSYNYLVNGFAAEMSPEQVLGWTGCCAVLCCSIEWRCLWLCEYAKR